MGCFSLEFVGPRLRRLFLSLGRRGTAGGDQSGGVVVVVVVVFTFVRFLSLRSEKKKNPEQRRGMGGMEVHPPPGQLSLTALPQCLHVVLARARVNRV